MSHCTRDDTSNVLCWYFCCWHTFNCVCHDWITVKLSSGSVYMGRCSKHNWCDLHLYSVTWLCSKGNVAQHHKNISYPHEVNIIVIMSATKQAKLCLTSTIITEIILFGYAVHSSADTQCCYLHNGLWLMTVTHTPHPARVSNRRMHFLHMAIDWYAQSDILELFDMEIP